MTNAQAVKGSEVTRLDQMQVSRFFGCNTFNERTMRERLPREVFKAFRHCLKHGQQLSPEIAQGVAQAMKEWALERGATHFTHWFLPMTGATAEKHDAFISWDEPGVVIEKFSGGQLIQGEPDASSFPSGGLRATFEARGYTIWDTSSPAFLMQGPLGITLCIPTAFVGYNGEALDNKVPLLRSMEAVSRSALKALSHFESRAASVMAQCGPEQEYFLVDLDLARQRPDLMFANRTLQGARPPKGQELEDHYFGSIKERVLGFMQELELECFKLGIPAKTRHNEVAPNQFEIAPIFEPANIASDHNQLMMELMKAIAERHGLAALLHEKPFAGINGSGKHVNWSLATDEGHNLLDPGHTPAENVQFLYFLGATLKGIHRHGGLCRAAIAFAGNDHRLGANEAPPAIMSVFLGAQLNLILDAIERGDVAEGSEKQILNLGLASLPSLEKDATDRNRTSPFAFTGNKFEFRAVGSSQAIAFPLTVLNAIMSDALDNMNARMETELAAGRSTHAAAMAVISEVITETRMIRFEGNNYSPAWRQEAEKRGLPHARDTVAALRVWNDPEARKVFTRNGILTMEELESRVHIRHEQYQKAVAIEAQVLREMTETMLMPAVLEDLAARADTFVKLNSLGIASPAPLLEALQTQARLAGIAQERLVALKAAMTAAEHVPEEENGRRTEAYGSGVREAQELLRDVLDQLEKDCAASRWPIPVYRDLLAPLI
jgi:glutamine synthetase